MEGLEGILWTKITSNESYNFASICLKILHWNNFLKERIFRSEKDGERTLGTSAPLWAQFPKSMQNL